MCGFFYGIKMFHFQLFLGFPVDDLYSKQLDQVNPNLVKAFIQENEDYLTETHYNEMRFIGKVVGEIIALPQLELLEQNVYSLLKKIVPDFPYKEVPLYLFPIKNESKV